MGTIVLGYVSVQQKRWNELNNIHDENYQFDLDT